MSLGPVQLLVVGFDRPDFSGEVLDELERLRESDVVRVIDLLVVSKGSGARRRPAPAPFQPRRRRRRETAPLSPR